MRDEVTCSLTGLQSNHLQTLVDEHSEFVPGFKYMPLFKMGAWDGKTNFVTKKGRTYQTLLPEIIPRLIAWGYKLTLQDDRAPIEIEVGKVDKDLFKAYGWELRPHQVAAINAVPENDHKGLILACTGAGKTAILSGIAKLYERIGFRSLTIVPSVDLIVQSMKTYAELGLDVGQYSGKIKDLDHQHVISTWQALQNNPALIQMFQVVMQDECLAASTLINMADGTEKCINDIEVGDVLCTLNEQTNEIENKPVLKVHKNLTTSASEQMYRLTMDNGRQIEVTGNHKFLTTNRGWVRADELTEYDILTADGNPSC